MGIEGQDICHELKTSRALRAGALESCHHCHAALIINVAPCNPPVLVVGLNAHRFVVSHAPMLSRIYKCLHDKGVDNSSK